MNFGHERSGKAKLLYGLSALLASLACGEQELQGTGEFRDHIQNPIQDWDRPLLDGSG
jgi:hypothetical protein